MRGVVCPNEECPEREVLGGPAEYRPETVRCPHCGAGLVTASDPPGEPTARPAQADPLGTGGDFGPPEVVAETIHRHEAEMIRSALVGAGFAAVVSADDAGGAYAGLSLLTRCRVLVPADQASDALDLLESADPLGPTG